MEWRRDGVEHYVKSLEERSPLKDGERLGFAISSESEVVLTRL